MVVRRKVLEKVALITVLGFSRWTAIDGCVLPQSVWVHVCMFALVYADADTSASFDYPALTVFGARTTQALCVRARQCCHVHPVRAPHPFKMPVQLKTTALSNTTELLNTSIKAKATISSAKAFSFSCEENGKFINDAYIAIMKNWSSFDITLTHWIQIRMFTPCVDHFIVQWSTQINYQTIQQCMNTIAASVTFTKAL